MAISSTLTGSNNAFTPVPPSTQWYQDYLNWTQLDFSSCRPFLKNNTNKENAAEVVAKLTSSSVHLSLHPVRLLQGPGCTPRAAVIRHQKHKGKISPPSSSINLFGGSSVVQKDTVTPHRSSSPEHHVYLI